MERPTREQLLYLCKHNPEVIVDLIEHLYDNLESLTAKVALLEAEVKRLKDQLSKDSHNSHKPPSSDGPVKRTQSLRRKSQRRAGGQKGHDGHGLKRIRVADHEIMLPTPSVCPCGCRLDHARKVSCESRQVIDIPPIKVEATDFKAEIVQCPSCKEYVRAGFPSHVTRPVQYGPRLKSVAAYLINQHLVPYGRTAEILKDVFGQQMSTGTLYKINRELFRALAQPVEKIKARLIASPVVNFDETGLRIATTGKWLHTAGTDQLTWYYPHAKRGREAMDEMAILPGFKGIAVHDHLKSYFAYDCEHSLCNAHHLRELTFLAEQHRQKWAKKMIKLLRKIKKEVDAAKRRNKLKLTPTKIVRFEQEYRDILAAGFLANPDYDPKRKRKKKTDPQRMLHRLKHFQKQTLAFMYDFDVPFDNNLAERDIRMTKVRQKISGCFRVHIGAEIFCRIRSYLSTSRKMGANQFEALHQAMQGRFLEFS